MIMIKQKSFYGAALLFALCFMSSCSSSTDGDSIISNPTDTIPSEVSTNVNMVVNNLKEIGTHHSLGDKATYLWRLISAPDSLHSWGDSISDKLSFVAITPGNYKLKLISTLADKKFVENYNIDVTNAGKEASPYIAKVFDFLPAPGQFINVLPAYKNTYTKDTLIAECNKNLVGMEKGTMISLGGYGGYVTFGFDHTISNVPGRRDFRVLGNAFFAAANPKPNAPKGGSCEPGIILVAYDKNKNGVPDDDEWYEIAGSEYNNTKTIHNYRITYSRPTTEVHDGTRSVPYVTISNYIKWSDNQNNTGYKPKNIYHNQSYYPGWIKDDMITFTGTLLPNNAIDESGKGTYWVQYCYDYGYVDNYPNTDINSAIDIDWAVDKNGKKVHLLGIDFIKVYNGMNQDCGWLGETSTEVMGAVDLHLTKTNLPTNGK